MDKVRLGLVGLGGIGAHHAKYIGGGEIKRCELVAVCDLVEKKMDRYPGVKHFTDSAEMIRSGEIDAVLIATPHYSHTTIGIDALENGLHVLVEKPISVHKADCKKLIDARRSRDQVFSVMFSERANPEFIRIKRLIDTGELGDITRVNWIVTDWFRTEAYYASGGWRATWKGEGGGVLLNQSPHQLDIFQWLCGMPNRVRAFCRFGLKHDIEVEDEVTAYCEYPNGASGVFITSTGEAPGTNRLEITGERGKVVLENHKILFTRNEVPMTEFSRTTKNGFAKPDYWNVDIPILEPEGKHQAITQNFVNAILDGESLIAPGEEGINSVELANAMTFSTLIHDVVELPMDSEAFEEALNGLIRTSRSAKHLLEGAELDIAQSFHS